MQEGYSTCLVNVLLEITRLPGTTFLVFPPSCVTSNLDDLNGIKRSNFFTPERRDRTCVLELCVFVTIYFVCSSFVMKSF